MKIPRLDLYLAAAVAEHDDQRERLRAMGVDLESAAAHGRSIGGVLARAEQGEQAKVATTHFGRPPFRRADRVGWDLTLWPEHRWELALRDFGAGGGEIVRRDDVGPPVLHARPSSLAHAREVLRPWFHTRRDLLRALGDPEHSRAAEPQERHVWQLEDGTLMALDFAHGLLLRVSETEPEPERRAPWWKFWGRR